MWTFLTGIIRLSRHLAWILVKTWCRFDIEPIWVYIWCIYRCIKVTRVFFNGLSMVDMACPRWRIIWGRCWADVGPVGPIGPLAAMFSRLLGSLHDGSLWWYCILLSVNLCIVYSYFHVCFICSLTIILCVIKMVQPTPLVVSEPGRYIYNICSEHECRKICTNTNDNMPKYIFIATIWHIPQLSLSETNAPIYRK